MAITGSIEQKVTDTVERHLGSNSSIEIARSHPLLNLQGRTALVTGASSGIGRGIAEIFAIHGANLVIHGRNTQRLEEVAEIVQGMGCRVEIVAGEIADPKTAEKILPALVKIHEDDDKVQIDILVNNAGSPKDRRMGSLRFGDWKQVIEDHLNGAFLTTNAVWDPLRASRNRARIINIGSISGILGNDGQISYATAKAGLIGFTRTLAIELLPTRGTANLLAFGPVGTKIWEPLSRGAIMQLNKERKLRGEGPVPDDYDPFVRVKSRMLNDRFISVPEAASKALFLASEMGNGITGEVISVDAGVSQFKLV